MSGDLRKDNEEGRHACLLVVREILQKSQLYSVLFGLT